MTKCLLAATTVEVLLRTVSLPRICRLLGIRFARYPGSATFVPPQELVPNVRDVAQLVDDVYRRFPLPDTCLRRALVAGRLLVHHQPVLVLGVRTAPHFEAHAWLTVADGILDWSNRHAEFRRI